MPFNSSSKRNNQSVLAWYGPGPVWVRCGPVSPGAVNSHIGFVNYIFAIQNLVSLMRSPRKNSAHVKAVPGSLFHVSFHYNSLIIPNDIHTITKSDFLICQ